MVNGGRLWRRLSDLAEIGKQESGGVTRLSFTEEERAAKDLVASYMEVAGLAVREDTAGNLFGRREGKDPDAPAVLVGSHVDSVYDGGNFDGPLGVLAGIEVAQTMQEGSIETDHPVEVVAFTDEEGARFSFGMIGSRALAGTLSPEELKHEDANGISIADAMRDYGLDPERTEEAARPPNSLAAYVELHIEQGRVLENEGLSAGVVTGIAAPVWRRLVFTGETGHAGTTLMAMRHDALAAAAEVMAVIEDETSATGSSVGTVGQLGVEPGGINIIPGRVGISVDLRDIDEGTRDRLEDRILTRARALREARRGLRDGGLAEDGPRLLLGDGKGCCAGGEREARSKTLRSSERSRARRDATRRVVPRGHDLHPLQRRHKPQPRRVEHRGRLCGRG